MGLRGTVLKTENKILHIRKYVYFSGFIAFIFKEVQGTIDTECDFLKT